jgi:hypothetical protein
MERIKIPKSPLGQQLDEATRLKAEATELLRQLEEGATGQSITKPGGWRRDPLGWHEQQKKR